MNYRKILPPPHLRDHVRYFWTLETHAAGDMPRTFKTIADGSPGLIFQHSDMGHLYQFDKQLPPVFLYGQSTRYAEIRSPSAFRTVAVYFYPHALRTVFGLNANELTDTCLDLGAMAREQGFSLEEQLLNAASVAEQVEILSAYIYRQVIRNNARSDAALSYAITQIISSKGSIPLKELHDKLGMSERSLERRFRQHIGMSPKLFSRICRFQASLHQLRKNRFNKLSDIAFENDYADQSHFIRAFKEFAGFSPFRYQQQANEIVENFPELIL